MTSVISDELLQKCYQISAAIVSQHGEKYLPIFERFHKEVLLRQSKDMLIQTAKNIAGSFGEQFLPLKVTSDADIITWHKKWN